MRVLEKTLKNGLKVILSPIKDSLTVSVLIMVSVGSKYENKANNGISHFLEHMCFKGTVNRPRPIDLSTALDSIGSQYNAFTSHEFTGYYAKANYKHLDSVIDIISDMYLNPIFNKNEIEKEKGVVIEEINMYEDTPYKQVQDIFNKSLYGDTPAGRSIIGPKENILKISQKDLIDYRNKNYIPNTTKVIISGNFNPNEVYKKIEKIFANSKKSSTPKKETVNEIKTKKNILIKDKDTDQTHIVLGVRTFGSKDKRNYTIKVLDAILGGGFSSRLFTKLREEMGVGYYLRTSTDEYTDHGNFNVSIGCDNKRVVEVIETILKEFDRLKKEVVSEVELKKAKDYLLGNTFISLESSDSVAEYFGIQSVLSSKLETAEEFAKEIRKVKSSDIKKLADDIFQDNKLALAIIGKKVDSKSVGKVFKL